MPLDIIHKSDSVSGTIPFASDLALGEVAVNYSSANPAIFLKDSANTLRRIAGVWFGTTAPTSPTDGTHWYDENPGDEGMKIYRSGQWKYTSPQSRQRSLIILDTLLIATTFYALNLSEPINIVEMTSASANTVEIPTHASQAFPRGTQIMVLQSGTGVTTIRPAVGVTMLPAPDIAIYARYGVATLLKRQDNVWNVFGDTAYP